MKNQDWLVKMDVITIEIKNSSPDYHINQFTEKYYKRGLYKIKPFPFSDGFAFTWTFNNHTGEEISNGNSLHATNVFKCLEELKQWINEPNNRLRLSQI